MPSVSVAQLYETNRDKLELSWVCGEPGEHAVLDAAQVGRSSQGLVGHLNFVHPNWIQILTDIETAYFVGLDPAAREAAFRELLRQGLCCLIMAGSEAAPAPLLELARQASIPVLSSRQPSARMMWALRNYLAQVLAESVTRHGVMLDTLGVGVLITGDSGVGKSELALELISRGSGLVADDVVELYHTAPRVLEARCPAPLRDFLEVRGLGMLNIRTIFGETAVRKKMNLKLIIRLEKPVGGQVSGLERLPLEASYEEILGVKVNTVLLPVAAGRNLAVLSEAAVRNFVLQLRGIDSTREFVARQQEYLRQAELDSGSD